MARALDTQPTPPGIRADAAWGTRAEGERIFRGALGLSLLLALVGGLWLLAVDLPPLEFGRPADRRATLLIEEPAPPPPAPVVEAPEDLSDRPVLDQEEAAPEVGPPEPAPEAPAPQEAPEPRRVYGVRKVYAHGLGSGGAVAGMGIVGKRGNTLDKAPDELEATEADLVGELAPLSTVSSAPVLIGRVRPAYSEEMIANRVSGTVRARLLVDRDGSVKRVEMLEDIGYGTREAATAAFADLRFEPALRDGEPVAVWITMKYRFEFRE